MFPRIFPIQFPIGVRGSLGSSRFTSRSDSGLPEPSGHAPIVLGHSLNVRPGMKATVTPGEQVPIILGDLHGLDNRSLVLS